MSHIFAIFSGVREGGTRGLMPHVKKNQPVLLTIGRVQEENSRVPSYMKESAVGLTLSGTIPKCLLLA